VYEKVLEILKEKDCMKVEMRDFPVYKKDGFSFWEKCVEGKVLLPQITWDRLKGLAEEEKTSVTALLVEAVEDLTFSRLPELEDDYAEYMEKL